MIEEQRPLKVLLINDDKIQQQQIVESLSVPGMDHRFVFLDDLVRVGEYLESLKADLVITDVEINGRETFEVMEKYQHLPWIVISAVKDHQILRKAFRSGAVDYIIYDEKNTKLSELERIIPGILKLWKSRKGIVFEGELSSPKDQTAANELHQVNLKLAEESHQRLLALEELRESREMYRRFFQTSRDAVFITSVDGRWIDMNRSALTLFGYKNREDIWADTMLNFYWDTDQGRAYTQKLEEDGFVNDYPMKFRKRDGSSVSALVTAMPYEVGGKVIGYQGLIRDMTDELKAKDENAKLQKGQEILDSLARDLGNSLDLNDIYSSISNHIRDMIDPDWIRVYKYDELPDSFKIEYEWGMNPLRKKNSKEPGNFDNYFRKLVQQISQTKQTVLVAFDNNQFLDVDRSAESMPVPVEGDDSGKEQQSLERSMVLTPVKINDQVIGIIQVVYTCAKPPITDDLSFINRAANIISISLKKAYLFQQSEAHVRKLSSLQRVQQIVLENLSLPSTLDMMVEQVVKELEVDAVNIQYYHPGLKSLRSIAQTGFRQKVFRDAGQEIGDGLAGRAAETKSIVHVQDLHNCPDQINRALEFSTEKFVSYYGVPLLVKNRLVGVLEILNRSVMNPDANWLDLLKLIAGLVAVAIDLQNLTNDLERSRNRIAEAFDGVLMGWANALELRGIEPEGHAIRTQNLTSRLANRMGISGTELDDIRQGALLHDIGKMGIPDDVLLKGSVLNAEEMKLIGRHPIDAYELLKSVDGLKGVLDIPLYHHERWDGEGYPYGLEGEDIPLSARIFAVVDVWDAMQTDRPYRKAFSRNEALSHLREQSGKHFDPAVLVAFMDMLEEEQFEVQEDLPVVEHAGVSERMKMKSKIRNM